MSKFLSSAIAIIVLLGVGTAQAASDPTAPPAPKRDMFIVENATSGYGKPEPGNLLLRMRGSEEGVIKELIDLFVKANIPVKDETGWATYDGPQGLHIAVNLLDFSLTLSPSEVGELSSGFWSDFEIGAKTRVSFSGAAAKFIAKAMLDSGIPKTPYALDQASYKLSGKLIECTYLPKMSGKRIYSCTFTLSTPAEHTHPLELKN